VGLGGSFLDILSCRRVFEKKGIVSHASGGCHGKIAFLPFLECDIGTHIETPDHLKKWGSAGSIGVCLCPGRFDDAAWR
jgi:hypothetical protein